MSYESLARWCDSKMGLTYSTAYSRFGYSSPEHYDCSGFTWRACRENGFPLEASVSWTQQLEGERKGLTCSFEYAKTHICLAIHGGDTSAGGGSRGHVCFTDGRGGTWEAMGTAYGLRKGTLSRSRFDYFMRLPGGSDAPAPPAREEEDLTPEEHQLLLDINNRLIGLEGQVEGPLGTARLVSDTWTRIVKLDESFKGPLGLAALIGDTWKRVVARDKRDGVA
jgi:hypothetical protein